MIMKICSVLLGLVGGINTTLLWKSRKIMHTYGETSGVGGSGYRDFYPDPIPAAAVWTHLTRVSGCVNYSSGYDIMVVRQFLCEPGVEERHFTGSWVDLRGYLSGSSPRSSLVSFFVLRFESRKF